MKKTYSVSVTQNGKNFNFQADENSNLLKFLNSNGFFVPSYCGGRKSCKKCAVRVDGVSALSCEVFINKDIKVELEKSSEILSTSVLKLKNELNGEAALAVDIGTTTIAVCLVDYSDKKPVFVLTSDNPQKAYGADVISRIKYCSENGVSDLQKCLITKINQMISELKSMFGFEVAEKMFTAGNTVMMHLFFGIDCTKIGVAPYTPEFLESKTVSGEKVGIDSVKTITSFPCVHSFFGGDLVAGVSTLKTPKIGKYNILIDLGTNAEIALISQEKMLCTSAAAGPCFEGANISSGMAATLGAITEFSILNGVNVFKTVGGTEAKGICGTGLIDTVAELIKNYVIDETGRFSDESDEFEITKNVSITQRDIREFQTANSAVISAIETLIDKENLSFESIDKLFISGGFSKYINVKNAVVCGLIPKELEDKSVSISNSSLNGCVRAFSYVDDKPPELKNARYIDLSADEFFSEKFIENMLFI